MPLGALFSVHPSLALLLRVGFKIRKDSLLDCQGAQDEQEGRPGGQGDLKTARGITPSFGLLLPGPPGLPSGSSWASLQSIKLSLS